MPRLAVLASLIFVASGAAGANAGAGHGAQELALIMRVQTAVSAPSARGVAVQVIQPGRPITGERTALPVIGHATGRLGVEWLHVLLPGRPNGHSGWIQADGTRATATPWSIVVSAGERRVTLYHDGRIERRFAAVVGKPSTPTPRGRFFVEEVVELGPSDAGAPYALALSARSNVLQEFDGGPGQIALHGLANVGGVLGTAASHGCVRVAGSAMRWLVRRVGAGTPVAITN